LLLGASAFIFLRGFANGGSAMTGMEAISNAVSVFREPQVRNARSTLVLMAATIGTLFLATSVIAALTHAVPFVSGTPTVLSEMGRLLFGTGPLGKVAFYSLQFSTALILILGANTSFNGFPLLVSFIAAGDPGDPGGDGGAEHRRPPAGRPGDGHDHDQRQGHLHVAVPAAQRDPGDGDHQGRRRGDHEGGGRRPVPPPARGPEPRGGPRSGSRAVRRAPPGPPRR
ncbi:MAG TPA: hypothetical protein VFN60_05525, partial [Acidimicrobiales bacterium]|nr:hypothetical protein [Acidimicrobiales bacterium]